MVGMGGSRGEGRRGVGVKRDDRARIPKRKGQLRLVS